MSKATDKLNGSVARLAEALADVVSEAVNVGGEAVAEPLMDEMAQMETRLNERIGNTDKNVQAQLAQNRRDIAEDVRKALDDR